MDFPHSPNFAAAPPPSFQTAQNPNSPASGREDSSNLTPGTVDRQAQPQSPRPLALSYPQHTPTNSALTFRAPAHTRAHHIHSIPPREKSTRTLIIDHLIWVHAVTRFAQARAELAMTDRTGGKGTPNFERRERPEQWDEADVVTSEGEQDDVDGREIHSHSGGLERVGNQDEGNGTGMASRQDFAYARRLRRRAESLEYVIISMLEQPPRDEPIAPQLPPFVSPSPVKKQILPNGVRLALALSTIINDLFARHAPVQSHLHFQGGVPTLSSSSACGNNSGASGSRRTTQSSLSSSRLPQCLVPLLFVSGTTTTVSPTLSSNPQANTRNICPRVRGIFAAGATYPITPSSSSSPRCPRHLHHSCEICIASDHGTHRTTRPQGASHASSNANVAQGGGITGFAENVGVGSGLVRSGGGTLLRREIISPPQPPPLGDDEAYPTDHFWTRGQGARDTILTGLIPRFVRLSALVALELGREIGAEATGPGSGSRTGSGTNNHGQRGVAPAGPALVPTFQWYLLVAGLLTRAVFEGYLTAEWRGVEPLQVLLTFGLGGVANSRDADDDDDGAVRQLRATAADEKYVEFEPDGMPNLSDAVDVLFPSRRANAGAGGRNGDEVSNGGGGEEGRKANGLKTDDAANLSGGEAEYAREMGQRLARFLDIRSGTRDLTRHLEDLSSRYPVKLVERACLRFCEALARWRGKPELEKYRKQSPMPSHRITAFPPGALESGGIGGVANAAVRNAIGRYFVIPAGTQAPAPAAPSLADFLVSDEEEDGGVVIGRKRAHSAAGATGSDGRTLIAVAGDRVRERRG